MRILLLAEHDNKKLQMSTYHLLTAAQQLKGEIDVFVIGHQCGVVVQEAQKLPAIQKVLAADALDYAHQLAENSAELIASLAKDYQYIMAVSSTTGKNTVPRVAALLDAALVSDIVKILSPDTFERYIYAGNALTTVSIKEPIKVLTIRPIAFAAAKAGNVMAPVETISQIVSNQLAEFVRQELTKSTRPELSAAKIIVSGGRGFKNAENFKLLEKLADRLGAAIGASRAAVDAGFAPNDYQVGQTGKVVAPDLYIAIGISGAIQHLAGMKDSKVIVAINNDPDAPIFSVADYGLVADLFSVLTEIEQIFKDKECN